MVHVATDEVFALRAQDSDLLTCLYGVFKLQYSHPNLLHPKSGLEKIWMTTFNTPL
jgi:hypothetical protein